MNTTISITPRAFGNIAAAAMAHGCDVTTYLIRTATARAAAPAPKVQPTPEPEPAPAPKAAPSSGMFDL